MSILAQLTEGKIIILILKWDIIRDIYVTGNVENRAMLAMPKMSGQYLIQDLRPGNVDIAQHVLGNLYYYLKYNLIIFLTEGGFITFLMFFTLIIIHYFYLL